MKLTKHQIIEKTDIGKLNGADNPTEIEIWVDDTLEYVAHISTGQKYEIKKYVYVIESGC